LIQGLQKAQNAIIQASVDKITSTAAIASIAKGKKKRVLNNLHQILPDYFEYIKATDRVKKDTKRLVAEFQREIKVSPDNINLRHISLFEQNQLQQGFKTCTVTKKQAVIKRILLYCEEIELISKNPYRGYKMPKIETIKQVHLTIDQLKKLEQTTFEQDRLNRVKQLLLLQCYTGFAYVDLKHFRAEQIQKLEDDFFLFGERCKNGNPYYVPLMPQAKKIIESADLEVISNQKYNTHLKELAVIMNWQIKLTTHVGRKTFAQLMINKGYSWEAVAAMLGHKKTTMTEKHYATIGLERIQREMKLVA